MKINQILNQLRDETDYMSDHAFISVQCSDLKLLLNYIERLEKNLEIVSKQKTDS